MSKELRANFNGVATIYATIRKLTDGTVWNGTALETWSDANIALYAVALASLGGDYYAADFPSAITPDNYHVTYYQQLGGSPAISDTILGSVDLYWNGKAATSTSPVNLSAYALTTLDGVKRQLSITVSTYDTILTELINAVSLQIERICGRNFLARDYRIFYNGNRSLRLQLKHPPVNSITRLAFGRQNAFSVSYTGNGIAASGGISSTGVRLYSMASNGTETTTDLPFATYASVSRLVTAINLVSGWTATIQQDGPSGNLYPFPGQDALGRTLFFTYPYIGMLEYACDFNTGMLQYYPGSIWPMEEGWHNEILPTVTPRGFQNLLVCYNAGFTAIPADVDQVCREIVQDAYNLRLLNVTQASIKLGEEAITNIQLSPGEVLRVRRDLSHYIDLSQFVGGVRT